METEEDCEEDDYFRFEDRVQIPSGLKERQYNIVRSDQRGVCNECLVAARICKKLIAQSYVRQKSVRSAPSKLDHSSWSLFTTDGNASKSALCLSTLAKIAMQKSAIPANKNNASNKGAMYQNSVAAARRRRLSELGLKRGKSDDTAPPQFVFSTNYKKYIEAFRREKLLSLQKHLFEDEIKAKFEEIAATLAVRRSFLDDLPETIESITEASSQGRREETAVPDRVLTRSQTTILPMNNVITDGSAYRQNISGATHGVQQVTTSSSSSSKSPAHINLDLTSTNPSFLTFQELQLKAVDTSKRGATVVYQKPVSGQGSIVAQGSQAFLPGTGRQQQPTSALSKAAGSNNSNRTSVAKVFDVASFILDRDLLRRKMAEQLRSVENPANSATNITVKPLGKVANDQKQDASPSPITVPNGIGKAYSNQMVNPSLLLNPNGDSSLSGQPVRLTTASDGEAMTRARAAQLSVDRMSNTNDSATHQRNGDASFSDVKYWLLMSVGGRNGNNSQNSGATANGSQLNLANANTQQPNLATVLKQQANELKSLQRQPSSNATSNDSTNVQVKLKTFNAAEAIPPSAKPAKPKHWSLTAGGQRFLIGAVSVSARGETNGTNANITSNANQQPPTVAAAHNSNTNNSNNLAFNNDINVIANNIINNNNNQNQNNYNNMQSNNVPMLVPQSGATKTELTMRLFSPSNARVKGASAADQIVLPSATAIANGASQIASSMMSQANNNNSNNNNMINPDKASFNIANVIVEALNRRTRYQQTSKKATVKLVRKNSPDQQNAASNSNNSTQNINSNNNGAGISVTLRLTTPADYPGGQRLQQTSPVLAKALSALSTGSDAGATDLP